MKKHKVYLLKDPRDNNPYYCGVTSKLLRKRLDCHIYDSKNDRNQNPELRDWILSLLDIGSKPKIVFVDEFEDKYIAHKKESEKVQELTKYGYKLFNIKAKDTKYYIDKERLKNGEYNYEVLECHSYDKNGYYVETFKSVSDAAKKHGVTVTAISRCINEDKYSASSCGLYWSKEKHDKIEIKLPTKGMTGKIRTKEWRDEHSKKMKGRKWSKEALRKRSATVSKPIKQMDENGNVIRIWDSQKQVKEETGMKLYSYRFGMENKIYGYHWDFA